MTPLWLDVPFHVAPSGRATTTTRAEHVRQMMELLLFTNAGERVNRPDFGTGLMSLVFAAGGPEVASATQLIVQASLQRWLGTVARIEQVVVAAEQSSLEITVTWTLIESGQRVVSEFRQ